MTTDMKAMMAAIAADDVETARKCFQEHAALLHFRLDDSGYGPLHVAARYNAHRVAEILVKAGADFYARDENGQLPLDIPPGQGMNETRRWLRVLNKSRNVFLKAVHEQKIDRVKELLSQDRSLATARDIGDGWSGVMAACHFGNEELLRLLLTAGATVSETDFNNGQDATYICAENGQVGCLQLLLDAGADVKRMWTVPYGSLTMQMNALHVASWKGQEKVVRLLLAAKVDPNERTKSYTVFSPLHFAASEGHAAIVRLLLAAGGDRQARDGRRGITGLEMAEAGKHEDAAVALRDH